MNDLDDLLPIVIGLFGSVLGIVIGSLLGAMVVRVCSLLLKFGEIPFLNAFKAVGLAMFVNFTLNFIVGFNQGFLMAATGFRNRGYPGMSSEFMFQFFTPMFFLHSILSSIFISALFFCVVVERKNQPTKLTFVEASSLSALSTAVGAAALTLLVGSTCLFLRFVSRIA